MWTARDLRESALSDAPSETLPVGASGDIVHVRQRVRIHAQALGFGIVDQTKLVTAASELARNALEYGGGGTVTVEHLEDGMRKGLRLTFEDHGVGIPDLDLAMTDGYTTGAGLGLGLSGSRRLVQDFDVVSTVGEGTRVTIARWK